MKNLPLRLRVLACVFWILAAITFPIWLRVSHPGWDARVYTRAMRWVAAGQDPYAEGIAQEETYYARPHSANDGIPFAYVYSPITLPMLKLASAVPPQLLRGEYWLLYALGALATIWVTAHAAEEDEKKWMALMAPAALFFPGLLVHDVIQSGNLAYILYGLTLSAAWLGWKRDNWMPFYLVVVMASCFKAPYLCLLAISFFSARREAWRTTLAATAGLGLFAVQGWIWPTVFGHYLRAVELQFCWNRDFGASPAGQFGILLDTLHFHFEWASWCFYLIYALPIAALLWIVGQRYQRGEITLGAWMPILLIGTLLLNPRHIEYDLAPATLPMALIVLRLLHHAENRRLAIGLAAEHFLGLNVLLQVTGAGWWRTAACLLMASVFAGGCWSLLRHTTPVPAQLRIGRRAMRYAQEVVG